MNREVLGNVVVVLDEPQDLVNIAGVVRGMKNMGLSTLRLVRPAEFDAWRITGIAHRTDDVVEGAAIVDLLEEALADCVLVVGTTARARTAHRNYGRPREWAGRVVEAASSGKVALLLGREDRGLSNAALDRCDVVVQIPTDPDYSSLNLAQAFLLVAYEIFLAAEGAERPLPTGKRHTGHATREEIEEMIAALTLGLDRIDFFKARSPEAVMRIFRTLLARARPDQQEAGLVKALGFEIVKALDRAARASPSDGRPSD